MTDEDAIRLFGLPSSSKHREAIRAALEAELTLEESEEGDHDLIKCLSAQLLSIGNVEDSLLIWRAKTMNFDMMCALDVQFLCGAGLEATKAYLEQVKSDESCKALQYLQECIDAGDFDDWTPEKSVEQYRYYFGIEDHTQGSKS